MKTIEALADYTKENSPGSIIDLELLSSSYEKYNLRFIIINDKGRLDKKDLFVHIPNHLKGLTSEILEKYNYIIFIKHNNRFNMVYKKDGKTPIFTSTEIPFIYIWQDKQRKFEETFEKV
jgi:sRNA-binding regulator protein Hfq